MILSSNILIAALSSTLVFGGGNALCAQIQAELKTDALHITEGKTIKNKEIDVKEIKQKNKGEFKVSKEDSFARNGYYTQTKKNGEKVVFAHVGVIYENGIRYTYYSSNVLYHYRTPEWTLGEDGIYRDDQGYIIVASNDHAQGTKVHTPFGKGIVRDCGCASGTIDIYVGF
ncbi:MAG: hypothetical protein Q4C49_06005 [Bacillota bacterium]|nr:hypothetical protein [Bacillota bacterium]